MPSSTAAAVGFGSCQKTQPLLRTLRFSDSLVQSNSVGLSRDSGSIPIASRFSRFLHSTEFNMQFLAKPFCNLPQKLDRWIIVPSLQATDVTLPDASTFSQILLSDVKFLPRADNLLNNLVLGLQRFIFFAESFIFHHFF